MNAEIVTTGTELLLGVITDTNSTYIARQFRDIGLDLYYITSAGDNQERVASVLDTALSRSDVIVTTRGMGPTVDDVTREAVAAAHHQNARALAGIAHRRMGERFMIAVFVGFGELDVAVDEQAQVTALPVIGHDE